MGKLSKKLDTHLEANLYTRKAMRDELGRLSYLAFGSKSKWRKLAGEHNIDIVSIKEQMEAIVEYMKKTLKEQLDGRQKVRPGKTENVANTTASITGSGESNDLRSEEIRPPQLEGGDGLESANERNDETPSRMG